MDIERMERILDLVNAPGTRIYPSELTPGRVVVIDGRSGLDACEPTALEGIEALLAEADGGQSPLRLEITIGAAHREDNDE